MKGHYVVALIYTVCSNSNYVKLFELSLTLNYDLKLQQNFN